MCNDPHSNYYVNHNDPVIQRETTTLLHILIYVYLSLSKLVQCGAPFQNARKDCAQRTDSPHCADVQPSRSDECAFTSRATTTSGFWRSLPDRLQHKHTRQGRDIGSIWKQTGHFRNRLYFIVFRVGYLFHLIYSSLPACIDNIDVLISTRLEVSLC